MFPSVVSVACVALVSVLVLVLIFLSCVRTRMPNPVIVAMLGRPFGCLLACLCLMLDARASCRHPLAFLFALHTHPRFSTPLCLRPFCAVACSCSYVLVVVCCCCCAAPACRLPVWLAGVAGCWLKAHTIVSLWLAGASLFFVLCCEPVQTVVFGQSPFLGSVLGFANCQFRFLLSFSVALFLRSIKRSSPSCIDCSCVLCVGVLLARS